jgi:hypothetical protein
MSNGVEASREPVAPDLIPATVIAMARQSMPDPNLENILTLRANYLVA